MDNLNSDNIHNLPQHLYQYLQLLQMIGYFPYLPSHQIDTARDERMITIGLRVLGDTQPTFHTLPNIEPSFTYLWN